VRWNTTKKPLIQGGLGIKDLQLFNEALWRFLNKKGNLRRKVVTIKYGEKGFGGSPSTLTGSYGHILWRFISKSCERFSPYFSFAVGDGSSFFWHDRWCDDAPLRELFPTLLF